MRRTCHVLTLLIVCGTLTACPLLELLFGPEPCDQTAESCAAPGSNFGDPYNPVIAGVPVVCTSAGTGQRVAFVSNPALNDVGRARPGNPPTIELNPTVLAQLPPKVQLFWYGHECAHHALGHTMGNLSSRSESDADCWSIQTGKRQLLFSRADVVGFEPYFRGLSASPWGHLPGPQRAALLVQCFDAG